MGAVGEEPKPPPLFPKPEPVLPEPVLPKPEPVPALPKPPLPNPEPVPEPKGVPCELESEPVGEMVLAFWP